MTVQELLKAAQTLSATEQLQLADELKVLATQNHPVDDQSLSPEAEPLPVDEDPIVGLFSGSPDLSMRAKKILAKEIKPGSGFTWKKS